MTGAYGKVSAAFRDHRAKARRYEIEFLFTRDEWVDCWQSQLGPHWFSMRGPCKGQYVMARNKDQGPYAAWNVKCILTSKNVVGRPSLSTPFLQTVQKAFTINPEQSTVMLTKFVSKTLGPFPRNKLYEALNILVKRDQIVRIKYAHFRSIINDTNS